MEINAAELEAIRQRHVVACSLAAEDFYFFSRFMFKARKGYKWMRAEHHKILCQALYKVYNGETKRLIINIPPRYGKTELAIINFIAWCLGKVPDSEFIHVSYSSPLALSNSWQAREIVQHEVYKDIFPETMLHPDSQSKGEWKTLNGGVVYSTGAGGTITGYGAGKERDGFAGAILIDDPHKADEARSEVVRKGVIEWFQNTLESRKNSKHTPIILVMQRLNEDDLAGWLLNGGNGEEWEHVCLPALREDNTALWPLKHDVEVLKRMQVAAPYHFSGQYQQRPSPAEGGIFKPDLIKIVDAVPAGVQWVRGWDLASVEEGGDFTAGGKIGKLPDGRFIIGDVVRGQYGADERDAVLENTAARDTYNTKISIPQDPGQAGKSQVAYLVKKLAGYNVVTSPESGDKTVRAEPLASQINVGNILMLRGSFNDSLINEMRMFPNGKYDDQIDSLSRAFNEFIQMNTGLLEYYEQEALRMKQEREYGTR